MTIIAILGLALFFIGLIANIKDSWEESDYSDY